MMETDNHRDHSPVLSDVSLRLNMGGRQVPQIVGHSGVAASRPCAELSSLGQCGVSVFGVTALQFDLRMRREHHRDGVCDRLTHGI